MRYNEPYSGMAGMMYPVDRHGSHHRLLCPELEVNQRLLSSAAGVARLAPIVALATDTARLRNEEDSARRKPPGDSRF